MNVKILLPLLVSITSFSSILFIIIKKMILSSKISQEDIIFDESFFNFVARKLRGAASYIYGIFDYKKHTFKTLIYLEKLLRKIKVYFLKIENKINSLIRIVRTKHRKIEFTRNNDMICDVDESAAQEIKEPGNAIKKNGKK